MMSRASAAVLRAALILLALVASLIYSTTPAFAGHGKNPPQAANTGSNTQPAPVDLNGARFSILVNPNNAARLSAATRAALLSQAVVRQSGTVTKLKPGLPKRLVQPGPGGALPNIPCCGGDWPPPAGCSYNPAVSQDTIVDPVAGFTYGWRRSSFDNFCWDGSGHITGVGNPDTPDYAIAGYCWKDVDKGAGYSAPRDYYRVYNAGNLGVNVWLACGISGTQHVDPEAWGFPGGSEEIIH
jgi:hypothetical protein